MRLVFADSDVEKVCTDRRVAKKLFGGNEPLVRSLFARLSFLESARSIEEVRRYPGMRFHSLRNIGGRNLEGFFAVDVKTVREPWRIILRLLDGNGNPFEPCEIDKVAPFIEILSVEEISKHYE